MANHPKSKSRGHLTNILFWSVISAAFIGPGTITTAASAGASTEFSLLWALLFSTLACLILQEAAARLTIVSGDNLGQAIARQFANGPAGQPLIFLVAGGIILGCAAFEAGNILGGVAGTQLIARLPSAVLALLIAACAAILLFWGTTQQVARILGFVVAVMGLAFILTALSIKPTAGKIITGALIPRMPQGAGLLIIGLIGTTVVPYNLFLGSSIAKGVSLNELRVGLSVSVILGGLISMAVLVAGTVVEVEFTFAAMAQTLSNSLGSWAGVFLGLGLFAAGFSSAITAPLAASITAKSLFAGEYDQRWTERSWRYRCVWMMVLLTGVAFGVSGIRPIPAIIMAQALNGVLLPYIAIFLLLAINDRRIMGGTGVNRGPANIALFVVVAIAILLGLTNIFKAVAIPLGFSNISQGVLVYAALGITLILALPIIRAVRKLRK